MDKLISFLVKVAKLVIPVIIVTFLPQRFYWLIALFFGEKFLVGVKEIIKGDK